MEPSIRPDFTSALAANAARNAVISDESVSGAAVVVGAAIVVGDTAVELETRVVVVELALVLSLEDVSIASPLAQAETMRTRTAIKVAR